MAAVRALWLATPALMMLLGEPHAGRLKSGQTSIYAHLKCELDRRELFGTGLAWSDRRRVTLSIVGTEDEVRTALGAVHEVFNLRTTLTYPSGSRFLSWWPEFSDRLFQDETTRRGEDIWVGECVGIVWSVRPTPGA